MRPIVKSRGWAFLVAVAVAATSLQQLGAATAQAQVTSVQAAEAPVTGFILRAGAPVPGLSVKLKNTEIGDSPSISTNAQGYYYFRGVPANVNSAYILQVWWGQRLVFQKYLTQLGPQQAILLN